MPKVSPKKDKNIYHLSREKAELTREKAAEKLHVSDDKIYRIEHNQMSPTPQDVVNMAREYKDPFLCNYYCINHCEIGKKHASLAVEMKDLPAIVLETLASLNAIDKHKERFIEITADCKIDESEIKDFNDIQEVLKKISMAVESLRLWTEKMEIEPEQLI